MLAWRSLLAAVITYVVLVPAGDAVGQTAPAEEGSPGFTRRGVLGQFGVSAIRQFTMTHVRLPRPSLPAVVYQCLDDPSKKHTWGGAIAVSFQTGR